MSICGGTAGEIEHFSGEIGAPCGEVAVNVMEQGTSSNRNSSAVMENGIDGCTTSDFKKGFNFEVLHSNLVHEQPSLTSKPFVGTMQDIVSFVESTEGKTSEKGFAANCETCTDCNRGSNTEAIPRAPPLKPPEQGRPHFCVECNKNFKLMSQLKIHERIHSNERPYLCEYCSKGFKQPSNLTQHRRIHTGERPYRCSFCEKTFKQKSQVMQHERLHTGAKPYVCKQCERSFVQLSQLQSHEKTHRDRGSRISKKMKLQAAKDEITMVITPENLVQPIVMN